MNLIDRMVSYVNPLAGLRRQSARSVLARYEAADPSRHRRFYRDRTSQNALVQRDAVALRTQARHMVRNYDLARGALRTLVNNVAGPNGIGIEPQPRTTSGEIHKEYAAALAEAWRDWGQKPEVTHQLTFSKAQRAMVRAYMRDGEIFGQLIAGFRDDLDHGTRVPLSLELFESDLVPFITDESRRIAQGIERNAWGRPVALHTVKVEPWRVSQQFAQLTKSIPWDRVVHLANLDHVGQMRGVSEFASVMQRLEDVKDYEESERVAAKIAAMLTAYVKKGNAEKYDGATSDERREIGFEAGMILDDLGPGEEIGVIDSKRPNSNLVHYRQGQLRAVAAGIGGSNSSISKDYNGTFSAQRQELVEQWVHYAVLVDEFTGSVLQPIWKRFIEIADLSGVARRPRDLKPGTADDAIYVAQAMPWIDPLKEALGAEALVKAGFASEVEIIRRRGANPHDVLDQIQSWRKECMERDIWFSSNQAALDAALLAASGESTE